MIEHRAKCRNVMEIYMGQMGRNIYPELSKLIEDWKRKESQKIVNARGFWIR
jgi:hypothetical protein